MTNYINGIFSTDLDIEVSKISGTISNCFMSLRANSIGQFNAIRVESDIYDDEHMEYFSNWIAKHGCRDIGRTSFLNPYLFVTSRYEIKYIKFKFAEENQILSFNVDCIDDSLSFLLRGLIINRQYIIVEYRKRMFLMPIDKTIDQTKTYMYYRNPVNDDMDLEEYNKLLRFL